MRGIWSDTPQTYLISYLIFVSAGVLPCVTFVRTRGWALGEGLGLRLGGFAFGARTLHRLGLLCLDELLGLVAVAEGYGLELFAFGG